VDSLESSSEDDDKFVEQLEEKKDRLGNDFVDDFSDCISESAGSVFTD